jgi:hypothetical protein
VKIERIEVGRPHLGNYTSMASSIEVGGSIWISPSSLLGMRFKSMIGLVAATASTSDGKGVDGFELERTRGNASGHGGSKTSEGTYLVPLEEEIVAAGECSRTSKWGSYA